MNRAGFAEKPPAIGIGPFVTGGTDRPIEDTTTKILTGDGTAYLAVAGKASQSAEPSNWGGVQVTLTLLQRMIQEILDPLALPQRPVKEWRSLYRLFFAFFAPNGRADEMERKAWTIAADVFNTNLVAVRNRTPQVVPMSFQDFIDGVDSFRQDGLREGSQRDIAWQPKKILLLMAALIGRIVAGWQADAGLARDALQGLLPFRSYLIEENRRAGFFGSVFGYEPRFSILEYPAAGLKPLLHAFPHFAYALMENGINRCESCVAQVAGNPPRLRAHFLRPLRAPIPLRIITTLDFLLLHKQPPLTVTSHNPATESSCFEFSSTELETLAFEPAEVPEIKCSKVERLFELAVTGGLLVCAPHRADALTAARIAITLGRTHAEQFVIERFFALGFRNGHGNEPWLEHLASEPSEWDPDKLKRAWKQFGHWKKTFWFFLKAGQSQAADIPGARIRQEVLQPKGSDLFLSLLNTPVYAPLMGVFLASDAQGGWLVDEPELHAFARSLNGDKGKVLFEAGGAIARFAESFENQESKGVFLFECSLGILLSVTGGHNNPRRLAALKSAQDTLRKCYERLFAVSLSASPSMLRTNPAQSSTRLLETKQSFAEAEQRIMSLLGEPLSRKVTEYLRKTLAAISLPGSSLPEQPMPRIHVESQTTFEASIAGLCAWIKSRRNQAPSVSLPSASHWLAALVELRALAEEGSAAEALEKAIVLHHALNELRKQALAPFFDELFWLLLRTIEQQLDRGHIEEATTLAERAMAIIDKMACLNDFKSLLQNLFAPKPTKEVIAVLEPSTSAPASEAQRSRVHQAERLLRDYAEELSMAENIQEQAFLQAVRQGSDAAFKRKEKLRNRLQSRTRWGGREPHKTTLKLLESITGSET
jgi:hypothetical protein